MEVMYDMETEFDVESLQQSQECETIEVQAKIMKKKKKKKLIRYDHQREQMIYEGELNKFSPGIQ